MEKSGEASGRKLMRVPRRTPKACKQCKTAKVRCNNVHPCARCIRRKESCIFPSDEPHVSVPESYLRELERWDRERRNPDSVSQIGLESRRQSDSRLRGPAPDEFSPPTGNPALVSPPASASQAQPQSFIPETALGTDDGSLPLQPDLDGFDTISEAAPPDQGIAIASPDVPTPRNPLVGRTLPYIREPSGRPRYLGPCSSWAFCRRAFVLLDTVSPRASELPTSINTDGTAFRLEWQSKSAVESEDLNKLPPADYALHLYNTVKFHLGELFPVIDEARFTKIFERFHQDPWPVAQSERLWFVEYLLILSYGKAFLGHPSQSPVPGSEYASRAMSLLPDFAALHDAALPAVEVLTLVALYFQSIDMRVTAYQYIGAATRSCFVEGAHLHIPDDYLGHEFAKRSNNTWWVVYSLDREFSALMSGPIAISNCDMSAPLPCSHSDPVTAKTLSLRVQLSRILTSTFATIYAMSETFQRDYVKNTTTILHRLAEVSRDLDQAKSEYNRPSTSEMPLMFRRVTLLYHHCIVLATRPLVMWLLGVSIPPAATELQQLAAPIAALLQAAVVSATTIIMMAKALAERGLLETFLPSQLEYVSSSGMLLTILEAILPAYIPDSNWNSALDFVLDEMIRKSNVVAPLRKGELTQLQSLLDPVRKHEPIFAAGKDGKESNSRQSAANLHGTPDADADAEIGPEVSTTQIELDTEAFALPWESLNDADILDVELMENLAMQFETGDLDTSFLL